MKRLQIRRQTLRHLTQSTLTTVQGGMRTPEMETRPPDNSIDGCESDAQTGCLISEAGNCESGQACGTVTC